MTTMILEDKFIKSHLLRSFSHLIYNQEDEDELDLNEMREKERNRRDGQKV